jgi:hypothetical protein
MTKTLPMYALAASILVLAGALFFSQAHETIGAGWIGMQSHIQTATTTAVGPDTVVTLFADNSPATCHSRVVTTNFSGIWLSFDDLDSSTTGKVYTFGSTSLAHNIGHWQPGSTTVAYDAGLYGCGRMTAYADATNTITISSF